MFLASALAAHGDELEADLQQHYGIDLEAAMCGAHSARHVAVLASQLPPDSRLAASENADARWTLTNTLLAVLANDLRLWIWAHGDKRRRGSRPRLIGPSWMVDGGSSRKAEAQVMTIDALMRELNKKRTEAM